MLTDDTHRRCKLQSSPLPLLPLTSSTLCFLSSLCFSGYWTFSLLHPGLPSADDYTHHLQMKEYFLYGASHLAILCSIKGGGMGEIVPHCFFLSPAFLFYCASALLGVANYAILMSLQYAAVERVMHQIPAECTDLLQYVQEHSAGQVAICSEFFAGVPLRCWTVSGVQAMTQMSLTFDPEAGFLQRQKRLHCQIALSDRYCTHPSSFFLS